MPRSVKELVAQESGLDLAAVVSETSLTDGAAFDSLDLVQLMLVVEDEYNLPSTADDMFDTFKTVGDVEEYVRSKVSPCPSDNSSH